MMTEAELIRQVTLDPETRKFYRDAGRSSFEGITLYPPDGETFMPVVRTPEEEWALAGKSIARDWLAVGNGLRRAMGREEVDPKVLEQE